MSPGWGLILQLVKGEWVQYTIIPCDRLKMAAETRVFVIYSVILLMFLVQRCSFNLVVNIKAKDGDVVQKEFRADPEKDYVTIDFMTHGSRYITVYIDFRLVSSFHFYSNHI